MTRNRMTAALFAIALSSPALTAPVASAPVDPNLQRAQAAMADLGQSLRSALQQKIAADGAVAAVAFCHDEAPRIASDVAARHGVSVGRTSMKHRNPANAPNDWQGRALDGFAVRVAGGEDAGAVTTTSQAADVLRVAKGIEVEAPCLMCHGPADAIASDVAKAISARYPQDLATGFQAGDLRGLIWAEVALAPATTDSRTAIAMRDEQQQALRGEMRRHLESVQELIAALAANDWDKVASAASGFSPGRGQGHGPGMGQGPGRGRGMGMGPGAGFRDVLPDAWFTLARPMHAAMTAIADEARDQQRVHVALARLGDATAQCTACHASFRIERDEAVLSARR